MKDGTRKHEETKRTNYWAFFGVCLIISFIISLFVIAIIIIAGNILEFNLL